MFQVFGVSSLGIWLGDGEGKTGRGIDETSVGGKEICCPGTVVPMIREDLFVAVDELVQGSWSKISDGFVCSRISLNSTSTLVSDT